MKVFARIILVCAAVLTAVAYPGFAHAAKILSREEIIDLYSQAKDFYKQANEAGIKDSEKAKAFYRKAALRYERIVNAGRIRNGKLFYNIGNAYFRMGDLGRAILYYRRATEYIPADSNLLQNLQFACKLRRDKIEEKQNTKVLKTVFFWHYDFTAWARMLIFIIAFAALWLLAIFRLFFRHSLLGAAIVFCGALSVLVLTSLVVDVIAASKKVPGVIIADSVIVRKGDGETYQPSFKEPLHAGTEFLVVEDRGGWKHIELADGRRCWAPSNGVGLVW